MKEFIDFMIGLLLLIAMANGVTHVCGIVVRRLKQLAGIVVARRQAQPPTSANHAAVGEPDASASALAGEHTAGTPSPFSSGGAA